MRLLALAVVLVAACQAREQPVVTDRDATAFANKLVPLLTPCDEAKLAPLVDPASLAKNICAAMKGVDEVKLLRVHAVGGDLRPVIRRLVRDTRTGAVIVGYDELKLRKTDQVRVVDVYSYLQGQSITAGEVPEAAREARDLQRKGKNVAALALIDTLPKATRDDRNVQLLRVRAAAGVGAIEYKAALDELATVFREDPSIAMVEADGALARGDWDAALEWIDLLDKAIGGDAVQDAHRAMAYLRRGDLELARTAADRATTTEPTLTHAWEVKLDVAVAQKKWADAIAVMTELEDKHGVQLDALKLAAQPGYAELLASPQYKEWRGGRQR